MKLFKKLNKVDGWCERDEVHEFTLLQFGFGKRYTKKWRTVHRPVVYLMFPVWKSLPTLVEDFSDSKHLFSAFPFIEIKLRFKQYWMPWIRIYFGRWPTEQCLLHADCKPSLPFNWSFGCGGLRKRKGFTI